MEEIKRELASIIRAVKTRVEIEKGFGIHTVTLSKPNKAASSSSPNSLTENKPLETPAVGEQIQMLPPNLPPPVCRQPACATKTWR